MKTILKNIIEYAKVNGYEIIIPSETDANDSIGTITIDFKSKKVIMDEAIMRKNFEVN